MLKEDEFITQLWNHHSYEKMTDRIDKLKFNDKDFKKLRKVRWVVTEKIHGSNFSIITDGSYIAFAKRKEILSFEENFFGFYLIKEELKMKTEILFKDLIARFPDVKKVTIYGELFGGYFPEKIKVNEFLNQKIAGNDSISAVQKGVYYSPNLEYCVFDILIEQNNEKKYLDYDLAMNLLELSQFLYTKPIFIGMYEDAIDFEHKFNSTIPQMLGYNIEEDNTAEGIVVKPIKSIYIDTPKGKIRPIIKIKNKEFSERVENIDDNYHSYYYKTDKLMYLKKNIFMLLNKNRIDNCISKIGKVDKNNVDDLYKLYELVVFDAIEDMSESSTMLFNKLSTEDQQKIISEMIVQLFSIKINF